MTIAEMHVWFRQYAQQMGMQNFRAILPEQIDLLINTSITDTVNQLIRENIGITNDRIITDNSKIGQINALRTLYKVKTIEMSPAYSYLSETRAFNFSAADRYTGRMTTNFEKVSDSKIIPDYLFLVDFSLNYKAVKSNLGYTGKNTIKTTGVVYSILSPTGCLDGIEDYTQQNIPITDGTEVEVFVTPNEIYDSLRFKVVKVDNEYRLQLNDTSNHAPSGTWYLGCEGATSDYSYGRHYSLTQNFKDGQSMINGGVLYNPCVVVESKKSDYIQPTFAEDGLETNYFPVRLIDDAYLADTLNDFVLKNRLRSPIIVTYNSGVFDLYIDKFTPVDVSKTTTPDIRYVLQNGLIPYNLRMSYIAKPAVVKYAEDLNGDNVDCDLPESMHIDILKHAVDLYNASIQGNLYAAQQQQQVQNREVARNQARPDNEGYQN